MLFRLIETRVVFEFGSAGSDFAGVPRLIETRVVFELQTIIKIKNLAMINRNKSCI